MKAQKETSAVGHGCRTHVPTTMLHAPLRWLDKRSRELPPSHTVGKTPCSRWAVLRSEKTLKVFLTPLIYKKEDGSSFMGLQIYNSHTASCLILLSHTKIPWQFREWSSELCGKGLFVSTRTECRRSFSAASAPGELSQDPVVIMASGAPCETGQGNLQWEFALPARHSERKKGTSLSTNQRLLLPWEIRSKEKEVSLC